MAKILNRNNLIAFAKSLYKNNDNYVYMCSGNMSITYRDEIFNCALGLMYKTFSNDQLSSMFTDEAACELASCAKLKPGIKRAKFASLLENDLTYVNDKEVRYDLRAKAVQIKLLQIAKEYLK